MILPVHRSNSSIKIIRDLPSSISFNISAIEFLNFSKVVYLEFDLKNPSIDKFCDVLCQKFELDNILENKEISTNGVNEGYGYLFAMKLYKPQTSLICYLATPHLL
jgi:hypothetical protein